MATSTTPSSFLLSSIAPPPPTPTPAPTPTTKSISFSSSLSLPFPFPPSKFPSSTATTRRRSNALKLQAKIRDIFMPALSSTMTEGKIVSWIKSEGDLLSKGDSVVVVESDKADMDVETFYDGILAAIVVPEGHSAPVGSPIGILADSEADIPEAKAKAAAAAGGGAAAAAAPPPPPPPPAASTPAPAVSQPAVASHKPGKPVATPYAKKLAKQHKVDVDKLVGTGPFGRITPADVEAAAGIAPSVKVLQPAAPVAAQATAKAAAAPPPASAGPPPLPGSSVVPFTTMQAAVSKNMVESLSVPTFRVGYPVTTDALDAFYEKVH